MRALVAIVVVAACSYTAPGNQDTTDGNIGTPDGNDDAAVDVDGPTTDSNTSCTLGERGCVDSTHAGVCDGTMFVADHACPPSSTCDAGHCTPPPSATACTKAADCSGGQVCDLFVVGGTLAGFCTDPLGPNTGSCSTTGFDATCKTGICAAGDGEQQCLTPCTTGADCTAQQACVTVQQPTTIEGTGTSGQQFCVPD